jgi:site-specific DNA-methyltransferase (adenine-specific)
MSEPYYSDDMVTLYHGDMREILPGLGEFDACITDPPYGETDLAWDRWPDGWPNLVAAHAKSLWCFGSMRMFLKHRDQFAGWTLAQDYVGGFEIDTMVWEKNKGSGPVQGGRFNRVHELATQWYQGLWRDIYHEVPRVPTTADRVNSVGLMFNRPKGSSSAHRVGGYSDPTSYTCDGLTYVRSVVRAKVVFRRRHATHPTEKPSDILAPLIQSSVPPSGTVLDPFAGSGSTLSAARLLGRCAVGIEADEEYCEMAAKRLAEPDLFGGAA